MWNRPTYALMPVRGDFTITTLTSNNTAQKLFSGVAVLIGLAASVGVLHTLYSWAGSTVMGIALILPPSTFLIVVGTWDLYKQLQGEQQELAARQARLMAAQQSSQESHARMVRTMQAHMTRLKRHQDQRQQQGQDPSPTESPESGNLEEQRLSITSASGLFQAPSIIEATADMWKDLEAQLQQNHTLGEAMTLQLEDAEAIVSQIRPGSG